MRISDWSSDVCSSDLRDSTDIEEWLVNTVLRAERIKRAVEMDYFPRTDNGCLTYNRPCEFMDICQTRDREAVMEMLLLGEPPVEPDPFEPWIDRKSVVQGKSVSVRVDLGGRRIIKKKNRIEMYVAKIEKIIKK